MPLLEVAHLSVDYQTTRGRVRAVNDVTFALERDEVLGIVGESGSGKSTLAQAVMGYRAQGTAATEGSVSFDGTLLLQCRPTELRRIWGRRIAMVHQNPLASLTPTMPVGDQVIETVRQHRGIDAVAARAVMLRSLTAVNLPDAARIAKRYPHELSGGQRQRIMIAIALSLEPDLMILDEPTTNLDATTEAVILDLLEEIRGRLGAAMIYISHNLRVIARIATRVAVMYAGELVESGPVDGILRAPAHPYTRALLACLPRSGMTKRTASLQWIEGELPAQHLRGQGCIFYSRCSARTERCQIAPEWAPVAAGHSVRCWYPQAASAVAAITGAATVGLPSADVVLEARDLAKNFGHRRGAAVRAVSDASLRVPRGSIVGLVGESGSGKSTLLRCIAGLEDPDRGTVRFLGVDLPASVGKRDKAVLRSMQMVFQDPESTLNPAHSVGISLRRHIQAMQGLSATDAQRCVEKALQQVRLDPGYQHRLPRELSGGEKQRVAIARAFLSAPELVLCDEPLSSLDVSVQSAICRLFLDLQGDDHSSYVFVSHDLSIVRYMADSIVVMYLGEVVEEGSAESFDRLPLHPYTEALFSATPDVDPGAISKRVRLQGQVSEADKSRPGCIFSPRCHLTKGPECDAIAPPWQETSERRYRCHWAPEELRALQAASPGAIGATALAGAS